MIFQARPCPVVIESMRRAIEKARGERLHEDELLATAAAVVVTTIAGTQMALQRQIMSAGIGQEEARQVSLSAMMIAAASYHDNVPDEAWRSPLGELLKAAAAQFNRITDGEAPVSPATAN